MTQRFSARLIGAAVLAAASVAILVSCSSTAKQSVSVPQKNQSQWVLPMDQYQRPLIDTTQDAQQLLVQKCMKAKGYDWKVFVTSANGKPGESWNPIQRKLFCLSLAEKYGYGNSPEVARSAADEARWRAANAADRTIGQSASTVSDGCFAKAMTVLGIANDSSPFDLVEQLANVAYDDATSSGPVKKASSKWRVCMSTVGVPDLPTSPENMPSKSISALRPNVDAPAPLSGSQVPEKERRVAVADAKCQISSGYAKASYNAEWDAQASALSANADALVRYGRVADKQRDKAAHVIASNAPSN